MIPDNPIELSLLFVKQVVRSQNDVEAVLMMRTGGIGEPKAAGIIAALRGLIIFGRHSGLPSTALGRHAEMTDEKSCKHLLLN